MQKDQSRPHSSASGEPHACLDGKSPKKFYVVGKSLFNKVIVGWVLGSVIGGMFVSYIYDTCKDAIGKSVQYALHYKSIQNTDKAYNLLVTADNLSLKGSRFEAQKAYDESLSMLSKAAAEEIPRAMHLLGRIYCLGRAGYIEHDAVKAKFYLGKAAEAGEPHARTLLMEGCRTRATHRR